MDAFDQFQIFELLSKVNKTKVATWNNKEIVNFLHLTNLNLYEQSFQNLHVDGQKLISSFATYKYEKFLQKTGIQSVLHYQKFLILVNALKDNYDLYLEIKIKYANLHEKSEDKVKKCLYQYLLVERLGPSEKMLQLLEESKGIRRESMTSSTFSLRKNINRKISVTQAQKLKVIQIVRDMNFQIGQNRDCIILYSPNQIGQILSLLNLQTLLPLSNTWGIDGFIISQILPIYSPRLLELALDCKHSETSSLLWVSDALNALRYQILLSFTTNIPSPIQQNAKQSKQDKQQSILLGSQEKGISSQYSNLQDQPRLELHPLENAPEKGLKIQLTPSSPTCSNNSSSNHRIPQLNLIVPNQPFKKQSEDTIEATSARNTPAKNYPNNSKIITTSEDFIVSPGELADSVFMFTPEIMLQKQQNHGEQRRQRVSITFKNEQRKISGETDSAANSCVLDCSSECPTKSYQKGQQYQQQQWPSQQPEECFGESQILLTQENGENLPQSPLASQIENRQAFSESITFDQAVIDIDKLQIPFKEHKQLSAIIEMNKSSDSVSQQEGISRKIQPTEANLNSDQKAQQQLNSSFQESVLLTDFPPPQIQLSSQSSSQTDPSSTSTIQQAQATIQQNQYPEYNRNEFADSVILTEAPNLLIPNTNQSSISIAGNSDVSQRQKSMFATSSLIEVPITQSKKSIPISDTSSSKKDIIQQNIPQGVEVSNKCIDLQDSTILSMPTKNNLSSTTNAAVSPDQFSDSVIFTNNESTNDKQPINPSQELKNVLQLMGATTETKIQNNSNMPRQSVIRNIHGDIDFNQSVVLNNQLLFNNGSSSTSGNSQNEGSGNSPGQDEKNILNIENGKEIRQTISVGMMTPSKGKSDQYLKLMSVLALKTPKICFNPFDMVPLKKQNLLKIRIKSPDGSLYIDQVVTTDGASIGRKAENSINFPKEQTVSSFHAEIFFSDFAFHLRDKGSKLGTYIKIKDILLTQEMRLQLSISVEIRIIEVNNEQGSIKMELRRNSGAKSYSSTHNYNMVENQFIKLGRDRERCEIEIKEITISNEHAQIIYKEGVFRMIDCDSRNGIWLRMSPKGVVSAPTIITQDFSFRIDLINMSVIKLETHSYLHPLK